MDHEKEDKLEGCVAAILSLMLMYPSSLFSGFVLMKIWNWFIPKAFGLQPMTFFGAMGIGALLGVLVIAFHPARKIDLSSKDLLTLSIGIQFGKCILLFLAWITVLIFG